MKSFLKKRSVCSGMVRLLDTFCDRYFLKTPVHHIYDFDDRVILIHWLRKLKYIDQQYGKDGLGIEIAKLVTPNHLGISFYIALSCKNLRSYMEMSLQYIPVWYDYMQKDIKIVDNEVLISWDKPAYYSAGLYIRETAISEELQVAVIYQCLQALLGSNYQLFNEVEFTIPKPKNTKLYENYFKCPVSFDAERTVLKIPLNLCDISFTTEDAMLLHLLKKVATLRCNKVPKNENLLENVNQAIIRSIKAQDPRISVVAGYLNMSTRVLQMVLKDQGVSFQKLLNKARLILAKQYLIKKDISIVEISTVLGYQEQTSFSRAFKTWTGYSPMRWRYLNIVSSRVDMT